MMRNVEVVDDRDVGDVSCQVVAATRIKELERVAWRKWAGKGTQ